MKDLNQELAHCALINFENFKKATSCGDPFFTLAHAQLVEAIRGTPMEETLAPFHNPAQMSLLAEV